MKALSLWQPWASLVSIGAKKIETRHWETGHRGELAIHAAKSCDMACLGRDRFCESLYAPGTGLQSQPLPGGVIVAVVILWRISPTNEINPDWLAQQGDEFYFGDFSRNRFGWFMKDLKRLKEPVQCRGFQQVWNLPPDVEAKVRAQL